MRLSSIYSLTLLGMLCLSGSEVQAGSQKLAGQVHALCEDVKINLKENPLVQGQRIAMGPVDGEGKVARRSNSGQEIVRLLREELASVLDDDAALTLTGSYELLPAELPENSGLEVMKITLQIKKGGKLLVPISREVADTDDLFRTLQVDGTAPHGRDVSVKERNEALKKATEPTAENPTFDVQEGKRVSAKGLPQWSVGILKKSSFDGLAQPVPPQSVKGLAFVPIRVGEYYEITLTNQDQTDAVATVSIDGLDIANVFSTDKDASGKLIHWPGYLVRKGQTVFIRGWLHSVQSGAKDSVFSFRVNELGQGAATALKTRGAVGVITVQFREACPPEGKLTGRSTGETAKGEGLAEKFTVVPMKLGENVLSTVNVRYNRPE